MLKADTFALAKIKNPLRTADFFVRTQHLSLGESPVFIPLDANPAFIPLGVNPVFTSPGAQTSIMPASLTHLVTP